MAKDDSYQLELFQANEARTLLDQLLVDSKLYTRSKAYKDLLDFTVKLRNFAPFNAMLLNIQKPGIGYAASARDWHDRFGRKPKEGARPLVILWPFGPVAFVYEVTDTEGTPLPENVSFFPAHGEMSEARLGGFRPLLKKRLINWNEVDHGDRSAGSIRRFNGPENSSDTPQYRLNINRNHEPATKFATLAHELAHLFLGHLGKDKKLNIPERRYPAYRQREIEAESVAYIVCRRNGVEVRSQSYLSDFLKEDTIVDDIDVYQVMRATGQVETLLDLTQNVRYERPVAQRQGRPLEQ